MKLVRRHIDAERIRGLLQAHAVRLRELGVRGPEPGEAAGSCLEEEFVD